MNKDEIRERAEKFVSGCNNIYNKKCEVVGFLTNTDGTEYLLLKTEFDTIFYGSIEIFTENIGLKFYGVATIDNKIHLLFFRGEGMSI